MAQSRIMNTNQNKLTPWKILTNNSRFNDALPPLRRNLEEHVSYNVVKRDNPNTRIRTYQLAGNRLLLPTKKKHRIYSSTSSINNIRINQGTDIQINFRTPSIENINHSISFSSQSIQSQRRRSSHLIENPPSISRECVICLLDQSLNEFEECYSNQCEHIQRTICDTCVFNYIKSLLENVISININCPESNCRSRFSFETIRSILAMRNNLELFEQYDRQLTYQHLEQIGEFVWCAHNGCGSGQFHDMGEHLNPMINCIKCKKQTCAYHRTKWHVGMTCQQYDQRKRLSTDDNTQLWLKKHSKKCPQCHSYIQKVSGCDHMTCKRCKHQFCWQCFSDYENIQTYGLRKHMKDCTHHPDYYRSNISLNTQRSTYCNIL